MPTRVPDPPDFTARKPRLFTWPTGALLYRVFDTARAPTSFNPGMSPPEVKTRSADHADIDIV